MNTFKLGLALWLCLIHPTSVLADSSGPFPDGAFNKTHSSDTTLCQAYLQIPISISLESLCIIDTSLLEGALDLDIQDLDADSSITFGDFTPDLASVSHMLFVRDSIISLEGVFPTGLHAVEVTMTDTCGRVLRKFQRFQISDPNSFIPICKEVVTAIMEPLETSIDLDNDGITDYAAARLYPDQFLEAYNFDCSGERISKVPRFGPIDGLGYGISVMSIGEEDFLYVNCEYLDWSYFNPSTVELIVTNPEGIDRRCRSSIFVYNGGPGWPPCGHFEYTTTSIQVETADGIGIPDVEVKVEGDLNTSRHTSRGGYIGIANNPWLGEEKTISLKRDSDPSQGVSVTDITILRQHLLGISTLPSPWHLLAADVNNDQRLSLLDILEMQAVILAVKDQFSNNTSWRFFDGTTVFENPADPWSGQEYPTSWILPNDGFVEIGFIGVKIGDLNRNSIDH